MALDKEQDPRFEQILESLRRQLGECNERIRSQANIRDNAIKALKLNWDTHHALTEAIKILEVNS